jgi:hypothetical protein
MGPCRLYGRVMTSQLSGQLFWHHRTGTRKLVAELKRTQE